MSTTVTYKGETLTTATNETKTLLTSGKYMEDDVTITDTSPTFATQTKSMAVSALPGGSQTLTISPDAGYDGLSQVDFTVNAIGYGTEGTPTATKGTVNNNSVTVTPKVVNTAGYIYGGTKTGTGVSVSASELVSGSETKTANGTYDVTNLAELVVAVPGGGGGGGGDISDPIRFFDYDGTLVASYKTVPADLPSVPAHSGLKDGTWNYTLAQVTTQFNEMGTCDVGANYMTESEDTEIDVVMQEGRLSPILTIAVNGTVTVDWGDNTPADTATGTSLTIRQAVQHIYASAGSYTIKIHVVSGSFTFYGSSSYFILRKNTTANENRVYANCVQAIRLGSGVTSIGNYAFYYCYALASVSIPSGVTSIGTYVFANCYSLASVSIPSGVTSIGNNAFYNCHSLASVSIPSGVTSIGNNAFYYCYSLVSVSLPSGVTSIGTYVFSYCHSLASVSIPSGLTSIGNGTFSDCYALASVSIPSGVTSIGTYVFANCYSLVSVSLPSGVTSIGNSTFANCYGMAEYHILPTTPPTLGTTPFSNIVSDCKIYVPSASLSDYQTAWSTYASYLVGE